MNKLIWSGTVLLSAALGGLPPRFAHAADGCLTRGTVPTLRTVTFREQLDYCRSQPATPGVSACMLEAARLLDCGAEWETAAETPDPEWSTLAAAIRNGNALADVQTKVEAIATRIALK